MLAEDRYFYELNDDEIWNRYCGFLSLTVEDFIGIQQELLFDGIARISESILGKQILNGNTPKTIDEFRSTVPITTYEDYEPYLSERQEEALAFKPAEWCHSAGRGGKFKWLPLSSEFLDKVAKNALASFILASTDVKGRINFRPGSKLLIILAPPPYGSGLTMQTLAKCFSYKNLPDPDKTNNMTFPERVQKGFQMALRGGVDVVGSLPSILVKMGEDFGDSKRDRKFSLSMLHPRVVYMMLRAMIAAKKNGRKILPKDLWPTKAVVVGGMDAHIYRDDITDYWGRPPYEFYISSEAFYMAMHAWNKRWMTFVPDMVFFEFMPLRESVKYEENKQYQPSTCLLNEVEEGQLYELVISHFYGMPLLRYRQRDIVKIVALKDHETGINLPQMVFQRRVDEAINIGGLAQLDEKTIWQAMSNIKLKFKEWTAIKEIDHNKAFLRLYIEPIDGGNIVNLETTLDTELGKIDTDYRDVQYFLEYNPVRVTLLSAGTFDRYVEEKVKEGADRAHLKPAHINPSESALKRLSQLSCGEER